MVASSTGFAADRVVQNAAFPVRFYDPKVQEHEEPFPGYADRCGYEIFLKYTRHVSIAETAADGAKVILIDPLLTKRGNEFHKAFLIAHECAHHVLGHTSEDGLRRRWSSRRSVTDQELSADCWAAEALSRAGLSDFTTLMSKQMSQSGLFSPGGGYPAGIQRATIIRKCAESGERQYLARTE
ncbi:hypothetical protein EOI86_02585 [Hwanghaeella grinnelliae]|uniref:ImmA/IrrE family metallo-endopeptidase n=1 Tax=Hwanghaeella grinnelliae TaxID=2500179 RepID=A0A437QUL4_9PROT|nr:hypothetical protein [Hwanghaeella grinnelliae]RVU38202.1 hypothetical protein EOI86_02585 [Hwanghaeella grinnelliae]